MPKLRAGCCRKPDSVMSCALIRAGMQRRADRGRSSLGEHHSSVKQSEIGAPEITEDAVLGNRLRLRQPREGHRFGHDAILLAAACPARAGEYAVELGAGVGAAGLALALRGGGTKGMLVGIDAALAPLSAENAQLNRPPAPRRSVRPRV